MLKYSALIALFLTLTACGKAKLDNTKVEGSITTELKTKGMVLKSVTCPAQREVKKGDVFECEGTTAEGEKTMFSVEQTDDEGGIKWSNKKIASQSALGTHLVANLGKGAIAKCPEKVLILKKGLTFTCPGELEGKAAKLEFAAKDDDGNFHVKGKQDAPAGAAPAPDVENDAKE